MPIIVSIGNQYLDLFILRFSSLFLHKRMIEEAVISKIVEDIVSFAYTNIHTNSTLEKGLSQHLRVKAGFTLDKLSVHRRANI